MWACVFVLILGCRVLEAETIEEADALWLVRDVGAGEEWASSGPLQKARNAYQSALSQNEAQAGIGLLRCAAYEATYIERDPDKRRDILESARVLGETLLTKYPANPGLHFRVGLLWARWGEAFGVMAAVRAGVPNRLRHHMETTLALDPSYGEGGPERVLGLLHFNAPYIPLILTWPSQEKAMEWLHASWQKDPRHITTLRGLAEVYYAKGEKDKAKASLREGLEAPRRQGETLEWNDNQRKLKALQKKWGF